MPPALQARSVTAADEVLRAGVDVERNAPHQPHSATTACAAPCNDPGSSLPSSGVQYRMVELAGVHHLQFLDLAQPSAGHAASGPVQHLRREIDPKDLYLPRIASQRQTRSNADLEHAYTRLKIHSPDGGTPPGLEDEPVRRAANRFIVHIEFASCPEGLNSVATDTRTVEDAHAKNVLHRGAGECSGGPPPR